MPTCRSPRRAAIARRVRGLALTLPALAALLSPATPAAAGDPPAGPPTVRLWATREGLVGRTTASGHVVEPNDHFVALPSRRALGRTVVVSYQGRQAAAPVLDVGPWNRDDAWWEPGAARGQFPDLPRWVPEAWAAWDSDYNGGRDAVGRLVSFPAMIDLADGLYAELGLKNAAWVDVTFPWLDGPSPPPLAPPDRAIFKKPDPGMPHDERYFPQTGFRVESDVIWSYFLARGQVEVFGYPVSRGFTFLGCQAQIFQRQVAQVCADQRPALMNILDADLFPYTQVNGSAFPAPDPELKERTPAVSARDYAGAILDFVRANAPDSFEGQPVLFGHTFFALAAAALVGGGNPVVSLEVWGAPISRPLRDPGNASFVYQRFQRGIMHYDAANGRTQGILLADYVKGILRDRNLPADLREQAKGSPFLAQYCPGASRWVCRPGALPATDLTQAFEPG